MFSGRKREEEILEQAKEGGGKRKRGGKFHEQCLTTANANKVVFSVDTFMEAI